MAKTITTANDTLNYILRAVDPAWRANAVRYIALHTSDPGSSGNQTTNEANYGSYARVQVTASSAFSSASGGSSSNAVIITFPQCTSGSNTITHISIGTDQTGAGQILYSGILNNSLAVSNLIQPQFSIGALTINEI